MTRRTPDLPRRRLTLAVAGATGLAGCGLLGETPPQGQAAPASPAAAVPSSLPDAHLPPPAPRELRAAWIASVAYIDWPARPALPPARQRADALAMLDRALALGLNALILQVRPAADALYASALEPWSEYLSGRQGRAPDAGWDPLAWWVDEAHRRGLELHAWFNPYRARHSSSRSPPAPGHVSRTRPDLVRNYGDLLWLDPGEPDAALHTRAVIADVVRRYDIDAVHIDDYFYPYPVQDAAGAEQPFPDDASWQKYRLFGGTLGRDDWRRDNVDRLVEGLYREVHAIKPWVRFGVSPFGIGRPTLRPAGIEGFSQYDKLYADVERWCEQGWFDYIAPQLYWPARRRGQAFDVLLDYWLAHNAQRRHVWPGLFTSAVASGDKPWPAAEVLDQVALLRQRPAAGGHIHFSMVALMQDRDRVASRLRAGPYATAALVPPSPWLDPIAPPAPTLAASGAGLQIVAGSGKPAWLWALWQRVGAEWRFSVQPAAQTRVAAAGADRLVVSAVDRVGNESPRASWPPAA